VLFLGVWEQINNPGFNSLEFERIRNEAGRNSFYLSARSGSMPQHARCGNSGATGRTVQTSIHTGSVRLPDRHSPRSLSVHLHRRKYQISPANPLSPTDSQHRAPADGIRSERHFRKRACNSGARLKFTAQQTLLPHARAAFQPDSNSRWTDAFPLSPKVVAMPCLIFGTAERCSHIPYVNYHFSLLLHRDAGGDGKGRLDS
jgi:hypothetical protein